MSEAHSYLANDELQLRMVRTQIGRTPYPINHVGKTEFKIIPEDVVDYAVTALDERIIASARSHMIEARALPMPVTHDGSKSLASRWNNWRETLFADSAQLKSCEQVLHFAQRMVPFDHRMKWEDWFVLLQSLLVNEFPWNEPSIDVFKLGDNPKSIPETIHDVNGVWHSNILSWHKRALCFCLHYTTRKPQRVVEIGGGYGGLARLWLMLGKAEQYTIVDLPEALFFAEVALRDEFGDDKVAYWGTDPGAKIALLPVTRLAEYVPHTVDLVINTGSLQEMSEEWVNFYMKWLDRSGAKFFYSLNYMGQPLNEMFESRSFWAPRPSPDQWITRIANADIPLIKIQSLNRSFCDVLYERGKPTRKFAEWSVLHGQYLNQQTYLEGLELLRQDFTVDTSIQFIATLLNARHTFKVTKEMFYICSLLRMGGVTKFDKFLDSLENVGRAFAF